MRFKMEYKKKMAAETDYDWQPKPDSDPEISEELENMRRDWIHDNITMNREDWEYWYGENFAPDYIDN